MSTICSTLHSKDVFVYSLIEFSNFYSLNRLSKLLLKAFNHSIDCQIIFNAFNGRLIEVLLPQFENRFRDYHKLLQVLVLSRSFQNEIKLSLDLISNYNKFENNYKSMTKWSFSRLNLLIASMANISTSDDQFFDLITNESFKPKFIDIYYKLKSLKVLSFLAIEPRLPLQLLSVIISETFLWTEPTKRDVSVMQLHSTLISHFSLYVKDNQSFCTHMREDFFFDLNECLHFIATHFQAFIDYLVKVLNKTQIDIIVDNYDKTLINRLNDYFKDDKQLIDFFSQIHKNHSLLKDEEFLLIFANNLLEDYDFMSNSGLSLR